jgi:hypothetical protein
VIPRVQLSAHHKVDCAVRSLGYGPRLLKRRAWL